MMNLPQTPPTSSPTAVQLLSNGSYAVVMNAAGSGYSTWRGFAVTRWRDDPVSDNWGSYLMLRDETNAAVWSASIQPFGHTADGYKVYLSDAKMKIVRPNGTLTSTLNVAVAGDRDIELRRVTLTNHGKAARQISLTSYAELVLGSAGADAAHPAFSKMFVETEWLAQEKLLLATRRPRSPDEIRVWAAHLAVVEEGQADVCGFDTDRMCFLGRGRTLRNALAMQPGTALANTSGYVLDPIFSLRLDVCVAPGASVQVAFWTVLADSREGVLALAKTLRVSNASAQVLESAHAHAASEQLRLGINARQAQRFCELASALIHANKDWRAPAALLDLGSGGAPVLWSSGISGDRVIVLARTANESGLVCLDELLLAQRYWQSKGLGVDVVVLDTAIGNEDPLHNILETRVQTQDAILKMGSPAVGAAVFILRDTAISYGLRAGLNTVARIVLDTEKGWPKPAFKKPCQDSSVPRVLANAVPTLVNPLDEAKTSPASSLASTREFDNGIGGFVEAGRAYEVTIASDSCTPAPWVNIIANPSFGFMASSEGGGYTWSLNSQQNPLTPWPNDPVSDTPYEVVYLRDEDNGNLWSATPLPIRAPDTTHRVVHGKGYSRYTHSAYAIDVTLLQFVPLADSVKLSRLTLCNRSTRISDDRIWLAYVLAHYIQTTGDVAVLDHSLPFLEGAQIKAGDTDAFYQPATSNEQANLYEHAARAIDSSLTLGAHGLPLIGTGDWNDGMNNVGAQGRGESVWVAWFLLGTIGAFLPLAEGRNDHARADTWRNYALVLKKVLEGPMGWDGEWYRRGYYDDGTVLGSHESKECRIDTIAQSWSLISNEADPEHAKKAMVAVDKYLIRHDNKIALLFTPAFEHTALNPGYIKGYPPGIRENGGQYTHGAIWSIFAYAKLGQGDLAGELFNILNPILHSNTAKAIARYQVEPYVACADVYSVAPYVGRGGWTWYTGSAAWLYRSALEAILGFHLHGDHLLLRPCIPKSWPKYQITYRGRDAHGTITRYEITVENPSGVSCGVASLAIDGVNQAGCNGDTARVPLIVDGQVHSIRIILG